MRTPRISIILLGFISLSCSGSIEAEQPSIRLVSPTLEELHEMNIVLGDSINIVFVYEGQVPVESVYAAINSYWVTDPNNIATAIRGDLFVPQERNEAMTIKWTTLPNFPLNDFTETKLEFSIQTNEGSFLDSKPFPRVRLK